MLFLRSVRRSGNGWLPVSTGSGYRQNVNPIGMSNSVKRLASILCNSSNIKVNRACYGIIAVMNSLSKLDQLNLDPAAKTEVAALIQSLIEQAERDAKIIQAKGAIINAKDVKIAALTHELAYYKRIPI